MQELLYKENIDCFPAFDNEELVGIVTKKELVIAHPNRIVADVMSDRYTCISSSDYIWKVKDIFDKNSHIENLLVVDNDKVKGFITRDTLKVEIAKHTDLLTGLYKNQYLFYNTYNLLKNKQNATVIFIDLNNFGAIDKEYGHINGDMILKDIASILRENITLDSHLCRYAGDEFAILTPYSIKESNSLAERLIKAIKEFNYPNNIPVSASLGISSYKIDNNKNENILNIVSNIINRASLASTKAKISSKNPYIIGEYDINAIA